MKNGERRARTFVSKIKEKLKDIYSIAIREHKMAFFVFVLLRVLIIGIGVRSCMVGAYENLFFCILAFILLTIPSFVERNFGIDLPDVLEVIILLFIFAAEILGELGSYYTKIPYWDSILHTVNGFIFAAIGFALSDILNRNERIKFKMSPLFLAITAFCFSMTIGVFWEFFEFFCDIFFGSDMQKDSVVKAITSTLLGDGTKAPIIVEDIKTTDINGVRLDISGYLDIGLFDTMKDLLVNFLGAAIFSIIGFFYIKSRGKGRFAGLFIPKIKSASKEEGIFEGNEKD